MAQYRTLRKIAKRMGWSSPATPLRRNRFDEFPMWPDFTSHGLVWTTSDFLINSWEERKVKRSRGIRLKRPWKQRHKPNYRPYFWRKNQTPIETPLSAEVKEKNPTLRKKKGSQIGPPGSVETKKPSPLTVLATKYADSFFEKRKRKL